MQQARRIDDEMKRAGPLKRRGQLRQACAVTYIGKLHICRVAPGYRIHLAARRQSVDQSRADTALRAKDKRAEVTRKRFLQYTHAADIGRRARLTSRVAFTG